MREPSPPSRVATPGAHCPRLQEELIEIVLEMQEKGCDTEEEMEVSGADFPHLYMSDRTEKKPVKVVDLSEDA